MIPADLSDLVGKVYNLCRVKTIRIAMSAVMDDWEGMILTLKRFGLKKSFPKGLEKKMLPVGLEEIVPGRYGGKLKVFWSS